MARLYRSFLIGRERDDGYLKERDFLDLPAALSAAEVYERLLVDVEAKRALVDVAALHAAVGEAVTEALAPAPAFVLCHISHVYPTGASLYFTVIGAQSDDPRGQGRRAKDAASRAIIDGGGTITHHHAVGADHRPYLAEEIGEVGVAVLRGIKSAIDPAGIMNPGKLVP